MCVSDSMGLRTLVPAFAFLLVVLAACSLSAFWQPDSEEIQRTRRLEMVATQIEGRGVKDKAVLTALRKVPRHRFVPAMLKERAYTDEPLPIGDGQTISQPYIVGWMTELIEPTKKMRVLEIGTGSGYQAAILAECVGEVDTIEIVPALGDKAKGLLGELGYRNVQTRIGDGYHGWPERAPYDAIILTAAPPTDVRARYSISSSRADGWWLPSAVAYRIWCGSPERRKGTRKILAPVMFVPMTGKCKETQPDRRLRLRRRRGRCRDRRSS